MSKKEDELKQDIERKIDESNRKNESFSNESISTEDRRDITKMQSPENWPDAPEENSNSSDK